MAGHSANRSIKSEWRRGIYREVLRRGDHIVKRYIIPANHRPGERSWLREKAAWERLGLPVWFGQRDLAVGEIVVLRRPLIEGAEVEKLEAEELADCLAALHEKGIVGLDPHAGNFLHTPEGSLQMIDFGRAKCFQPNELRSLLAIGHELYRVERDALQGAPFHGYLSAYRQRRPRGWWLVRTAYWLHRSGRGVASTFGA